MITLATSQICLLVYFIVNTFLAGIAWKAYDDMTPLKRILGTILFFIAGWPMNSTAWVIRNIANEDGVFRPKFTKDGIFWIRYTLLWNPTIQENGQSIHLPSNDKMKKLYTIKQILGCYLFIPKA